MSALVLLILLIVSPAWGAVSPDPRLPEKLQQLYDLAFNDYRSGDYSHALQLWNEILRLDPEQKTARQMIEDVREEIKRKNSAKIKRLFGFVRRGDYRNALLSLQSLIEEDATLRQYQTLQSSLEELTAIIPKVPNRSKSWRIAALGLGGLLEREDAKLAYNGLRYAQELNPSDKHFPRLLEWLLSRHRELPASDSVTPGVKLLDYKHLVALHHIYDGKYHLAVDVLNEILSLEPDNLLALKRRGSAYYQLGHPARAREDWLRALKIAPQDAQLNKFLKKVRRNTKTASKP